METLLKAEYPANCNEVTKNFVDNVNAVIEAFDDDSSCPIILDNYYMGLNGIYHTIIKVAFHNHVFVTFTCFDNEGNHYDPAKEHYETVKVIQYSPDLNVAETIQVQFDSNNRIIELITHMMY